MGIYNNHIKKWIPTAKDIGWIILIIIGVTWLWSKLVYFAAPVIVGLLIFMVIEPLALWLNRRGLKKSFSTGISVLIWFLGIGGILGLISTVFIIQFNGLIDKVPELTKLGNVLIHNSVSIFNQNVDKLPDVWVEKLKENSEGLTNTVVTASISWVKKLMVTVTSIPTLAFNLIIGLILACILSAERKSNQSSVKIPKTVLNIGTFLKDNVLKGISGYLKAQTKLIGITFILIFLCLTFLKVENAFSISVISAIFDVLPILGVSTIFIPWILYLFFVVGNTKLAILLSILFIVVMGTRQVLEPRILGNSLGISAFWMLTFMVIFLSIFGVAGMLFTPVLAIILKALWDGGYLKSWIRMPPDEF